MVVSHSSTAAHLCTLAPTIGIVTVVLVAGVSASARGWWACCGWKSGWCLSTHIGPGESVAVGVFIGVAIPVYLLVMCSLLLGRVTIKLLTVRVTVKRGTAMGWAALTSVKPAKMSHECMIRHVPQLLVVVQSSLDWLSFDWGHADGILVAVGDVDGILPVLVLDDLVHILWWWCLWVASLRLVIGQLKLRLLSLLVLLAIVVGYLEDLPESLWWSLGVQIQVLLRDRRVWVCHRPGELGILLLVLVELWLQVEL